MPSILLVCHASADVGIGHLSRLLALANWLRKDAYLTPEFLIFGDCVRHDSLIGFKVHISSIEFDFSVRVKSILDSDRFKAVVFDLHMGHKIANLSRLFLQLKQRDICLISIDSLIRYCNILNLIWVPSFDFDCSKYAYCNSVLKSGWGSFLIQKKLHRKDWSPGNKVLILTGGSDVANLGETLPIQLDALLNPGSEVHWVRGPFSNAPNLPRNRRLNWVVNNAPEGLDELIVQSNYVMTVFGVSFFEVLQYGIPTVVFSTYSKDKSELESLSKEKVAIVASDPDLATMELVNLMNNNKRAKECSINALEKMSINGVQSLCDQIYYMMKIK